MPVYASRGEIRAIDRGHYYTPDQMAEAYGERLRLLRLMADFDPKKKRIREPVTYDAPVGKWEAEERKCSKCPLPTRFRTPRGRPVHPTCEGWIDDLTPNGAVEVLFALSDLGVASVEVK
jgi:hypothetical protein